MTRAVTRKRKTKKSEQPESDLHLCKALSELASAISTINELALLSFQAIPIADAEITDIRCDVGTGQPFALRPADHQRNHAEAIMRLVVLADQASELHQNTEFPRNAKDWELCLRLVNFGKQLRQCEFTLSDKSLFRRDAAPDTSRWLAQIKAQRRGDDREPCLVRFWELQAEGLSKRNSIARVAKEFEVGESTLWKWLSEIRSEARMHPAAERFFRDVIAEKQKVAEEMEALERQYANICAEQLDRLFGESEE